MIKLIQEEDEQFVGYKRARMIMFDKMTDAAKYVQSTDTEEKFREYRDQGLSKLNDVISNQQKKRFLFNLSLIRKVQKDLTHEHERSSEASLLGGTSDQESGESDEEDGGRTSLVSSDDNSSRFASDDSYYDEVDDLNCLCFTEQEQKDHDDRKITNFKVENAKRIKLEANKL